MTVIEETDPTKEIEDDFDREESIGGQKKEQQKKKIKNVEGMYEQLTFGIAVVSTLAFPTSTVIAETSSSLKDLCTIKETLR